VPVLPVLIQSFVSVQFDYISVGFEIKTLCYGSFVCFLVLSQRWLTNDDDTSSMAASITNKIPAKRRFVQRAVLQQVKWRTERWRRC
jgi:hypothetical protein